jgi:hypothetical protein
MIDLNPTRLSSLACGQSNVEDQEFDLQYKTTPTSEDHVQFEDRWMVTSEGPISEDQERPSGRWMTAPQ